jgi:hypothetical protein
MTLALATVHECAHTVLYFQNDEVLNATGMKRKFLSSFLKSNGGKDAQSNFDPNRFSTREVNDTIAQAIFHSCFQQSRSSLDFITSMAMQHPLRKYLDVCSASDAVSSVLNSPVLSPSSTSSQSMTSYREGAAKSSAEAPPSFDVSVMRRVSHQASLSWSQLSDEMVELMSPSALIKLKSGSGSATGHPAARQHQQSVPSSAYIRNTSHALFLASGSDLGMPLGASGASSGAGSRKPLTYTHSSTLFAGQVPATSMWNLIDSKISRYLRLSLSSHLHGRSEVDVNSHCRFLSSPSPIYTSSAPASPGNLLTLVTNSSIVVPSLQACLENTAHKLQSGAFLHHYMKYGVTKDHIITALESIQSIVEAYKELD